MWKYLFSIFCLGANIHCYAADFGATNHFVSPNLELKQNTFPPTPKNIPLPAFGQRIIGWGTGAEGARQRLENIQPADVSMIKKTRHNLGNDYSLAGFLRTRATTR